MVIGVPVLKMMLCQVAAFPVEKVPGVALLTAALSKFRILTMSSANVSFADGHRKDV